MCGYVWLMSALAVRRQTAPSCRQARTATDNSFPPSREWVDGPRWPGSDVKIRTLGRVSRTKDKRRLYWSCHESFGYKRLGSRPPIAITGNWRAEGFIAYRLRGFFFLHGPEWPGDRITRSGVRPSHYGRSLTDEQVKRLIDAVRGLGGAGTAVGKRKERSVASAGAGQRQLQTTPAPVQSSMGRLCITERRQMKERAPRSRCAVAQSACPVLGTTAAPTITA